MKSKIPYSTQTIDNNDIKNVIKVLKSDYLTQGPILGKFEKAISKFCKSKYALGVNSATSALYLACAAINFKKKDILWTTPNTFVGTSNCALHLGGKVDFVDIDYIDGNIDINDLNKKLLIAKKKGNLPKVVIPVHFAGLPTKQREIYKLSKKYNFKIIEDASHSLGAKYYNHKVGNCFASDITVFSMHPVKTITTGEGGVITTNNKKIYEKIKILRNSGITRDKKYFVNKNYKKYDWYYEQQLLGMNFRMNEISAALGLSQLKKINFFVSKRNKIAKIYKKYLDNKFLILPKINKNILSAFHLYVIKIKHKKYKDIRNQLFNYLRKKNILVNVHYIPVHSQPYYRKIQKFQRKQLYLSEKHGESSLSIPVYPKLKNKEQFKIIKLINGFLKKL